MSGQSSSVRTGGLPPMPPSPARPLCTSPRVLKTILVFAAFALAAAAIACHVTLRMPSVVIPLAAASALTGILFAALCIKGYRSHTQGVKADQMDPQVVEQVKADKVDPQVVERFRQYVTEFFNDATRETYRAVDLMHAILEKEGLSNKCFSTSQIKVLLDLICRECGLNKACHFLDAVRMRERGVQKLRFPTGLDNPHRYTDILYDPSKLPHVPESEHLLFPQEFVPRSTFVACCINNEPNNRSSNDKHRYAKEVNSWNPQLIFGRRLKIDFDGEEGVSPRTLCILTGGTTTHLRCSIYRPTWDDGIIGVDVALLAFMLADRFWSPYGKEQIFNFMNTETDAKLASNRKDFDLDMKGRGLTAEWKKDARAVTPGAEWGTEYTPDYTPDEIKN